MGNSSVEAGATASDTVAEEVSLFSTTDMIMFSLIVGFLTYWFLFRKKKDEVPEFTKIQTTTSSVKDSTFVEKMKKTVSFLFVLGPGGCAGASSRRPASLDGRRSGREAGSTPCVRTFWANQSLEAALLLLGQFTPLFECLLLERTKL
uniref:Cytochrome p450 oxidoreductase n=1 Tax=Phocoena sinus TaxID=42100 RepID=A0A8C9DZP8_PHOSS